MIQHRKSLDWPGRVRLRKRRLRENDGCPSGVFATRRGCRPLVKVSLLRCRFPTGRRPRRGAPFGAKCLLQHLQSPSGLARRPPLSGWALGPAGLLVAVTEPAGAGCDCLRQAHGCLPHEALLLLRPLKPCCLHPIAYIKTVGERWRGGGVSGGGELQGPLLFCSQGSSQPGLAPAHWCTPEQLW